MKTSLSLIALYKLFYFSVNSQSINANCPWDPSPLTVPEDDDVTYAELKTTGSVHSLAVSQRGPAENAGSGTNPNKMAAVYLGLLCVVLLTVIILLCANHNRSFKNIIDEHSSLSQNFSLLERDVEQLQRNYSILTEENAKLKKNYSRLVNITEELERERSKLQTEITDFYDILSYKYPSMNKYCNFSSEETEIHCEPCPQSWHQHGSKCYYFSDAEKNWTDSHKDCIKQGAHLVIIESMEEQEFINKHTTELPSWIGLLKLKNTWFWVDSTSVVKSFWNRKQTYPNEPCACTYKDHWYQLHCRNPRRWICETDSFLFKTL
ncbi:hypothetical protein MATL_G00043510 [Megalops atlanticus]|uniref:C-type lectin domain-containing protein n=1 Tax=Megalops atlanticus TaxID=7932 RepID=A0A9D3TB88_MEGAT|nr:hypothetical protein MATL_G00043510 [Megalops atlanticus]